MLAIVKAWLSDLRLQFVDWLAADRLERAERISNLAIGIARGEARQALIERDRFAEKMRRVRAILISNLSTADKIAKLQTELAVEMCNSTGGSA